MCIPERRFTGAIPERKWLLSAAERETYVIMTPDDVSEAKIEMLIKFY